MFAARPTRLSEHLRADKPVAFRAGCRAEPRGSLRSPQKRLPTPSVPRTANTASVRCGSRADAQYETDATIVVEVWSPSNDALARTAKLYAYQTLRSVELILFVDPERMVATVHERTAEGIWGERQIGATGTLPLGDGTEIDFAGLWADVSFSKGCYVGQEIIARMESRGKLAKRLVRLRPAAPVAAAPNRT